MALEEKLFIRMDRKLFHQLWRYAKQNSRGNVSKVARQALQKFLDEQTNN
jgi:hypothetical protein